MSSYTHILSVSSLNLNCDKNTMEASAILTTKNKDKKSQFPVEGLLGVAGIVVGGLVVVVGRLVGLAGGMRRALTARKFKQTITTNKHNVFIIFQVDYLRISQFQPFKKPIEQYFVVTL